MAKNSEPKTCSTCSDVLTELNQSEALRKYRRKLCTPCASKRTASYEPRYAESKLKKQREKRRAASLLRKKPTDMDRLQKFFKPGEADACWPWIGAVNKQTGYGMFRLNGTTVSAPRAVLILSGNVDMTGMDARHKCDNRICVNPNHLEPGSHKENMQDAVKRNRVCKGDKRVNAALNAKRVALRKMTEEQALEAYKRVMDGSSRAIVANEIGVSRSAIDCVVTGKTWSHVTGATCKRHTWKTQSQDGVATC